MKRQSKSYWCGVASISSALEVLGIKRSQKEVARLCHVTPSAGTDETEMKRALLANQVNIDEYTYSLPYHAGGTSNLEQKPTAWLWNQLNNYGPAILCVDNDEHWVTAIGVCNFNWIVFDPSRDTGVEIHTDESLKDRWVNSDGVFYGLGCSLSGN